MAILCHFWVFTLNYLWLLFFFFAILNYFILCYFRLCEAIIGYFWLFKVISPYIFTAYYQLYYHMQFVVIILVVIIGYFIGCLLMAISCSSISGY